MLAHRRLIIVTLVGVVGVVCWASVGVADLPKWTVRVTEGTVPNDLKAEIQAVLSPTTLEVRDENGQVVAHFWRRKELPLKGKELADGYAAIPEGTLIGAVQWLQPWSDYRKQKVKPGVYTLRFARQPMDGDHMGTAPYNEFLLLVPAALDEKPEPLAVDDLHTLSGKSVGRKHPSMMLLFPYRKGTSNTTQLTARPQEHLTLDFTIPVNGGGELGFAATVIGHTMAE
ncbi:MAG: hypothetical protein NZ703_00070 [Gemmataceae bacterium]|nr:hypothetical protein [Gemmataceae bacterium]